MGSSHSKELRKRSKQTCLTQDNEIKVTERAAPSPGGGASTAGSRNAFAPALETDLVSPNNGAYFARCWELIAGVRRDKGPLLRLREKGMLVQFFDTGHCFSDRHSLPCKTEDSMDAEA